MSGVTVQWVVDALGLYNFTPCVDLGGHRVTVPDINRPALQLSGYFDHFMSERVQIIGTVEYSYIQQLPQEQRYENYRKFLSYDLPCVVFCHSFEPEQEFLEIAASNGIPVLGTSDTTSSFMSDIIYKLSSELAPCISIHGVLVDVYGEGVLIMGDSGIGKSEAALELIRRGHRLVTDDVVEIRKINSNTLVGTSPDITRYFIELRGIGIVDIKTLFGVECVKEKQNIDLVIKLEEWKAGEEYDRLGLEEEYTEILGNKIVCYSIPIRPGRNIAVICETAAVNHRQKKMGYNAAQELYRRVQENIAGKSSMD